MKKKRQLNEQELLNEFIGSIVQAIFKKKARKVSTDMFKDPRLADALDDYIKDTKEFKAELKRLGYTSIEDLKAATKASSRIPDYIQRV